ncbi:MAG: DNA-binding response regulator [Bacteroidetes bacterium]|nr:MAG: DNA-binding response regulator [Bacteroidota bacterium]
MRIVIIEDEEITASDLAASIRKAEPMAEIVAVLSSVKESVTFFQQNKTPLDLIFSDIQLGDGLSFEIFKKTPVTTPIIFCTAYDEYALNAFKVNSIHYMLKPFSSKTVGEALAKFKELKANLSQDSAQYGAILELLNNRQSKSSVLVYQNDKILPIRIEEIALFYIDTGVTYLLTFDQKTYSINNTLDVLEQMTSSNFYRVNRQFLVNRKAIKDTSYYFSRKLAVNLSVPFEERITISKEKATDFLNWLVQF